MHQEIIRYLKEEERACTRSLYEECFPEDSGAFVDYYYLDKIRDNQILVMEEPGCEAGAGSGWPQVMLHLNPFAFQFGREQIGLNYIVAVAAAPDARRKGKMFRCMNRALSDMSAQNQPFTFLIPANPKVYRSSGFAFLPEGERWELAFEEYEKRERAFEENEKRKLAVRPARLEDLPELVSFFNNTLAGQQDVFPMGSQEYLLRLCRELAAQEGELLVVEDANGLLDGAQDPGDLVVEDANGLLDGFRDLGKHLAGLAAYGREEEEGELQHFLSPADTGIQGQVAEAIREYLLGQGITKLSVAEMPFMVRILDLSRLMALLGGVSRKPFRLRVRLTDEILPENNGCFELYCREGTGGMCRISEELAECEMGIEELAEFLFGKIRVYIREWV